MATLGTAPAAVAITRRLHVICPSTQAPAFEPSPQWSPTEHGVFGTTHGCVLASGSPSGHTGETPSQNALARQMLTEALHGPCRNWHEPRSQHCPCEGSHSSPSAGSTTPLPHARNVVVVVGGAVAVVVVDTVVVPVVVGDVCDV